MITAPGPSVRIGRCKQSLHFRSCQETNLNARKSLAGDGQDPLDLFRMSGRLEGRVAKERADRGESQITTAGSNAAPLLQVIQEGGDQWRVELFEC